jgi:hypothetical protein
VGLIVGALIVALLVAMKSLHNDPESGLDLLAPLATLFQPTGMLAWVRLTGLLFFSMIVALATGATYAARSGSKLK